MIYASKKKKMLAIILIITVLTLLFSGCHNDNPSTSAPKINAGMQEIAANNFAPIINELVSGEVFYGQATDDISSKSWDFTLCINSFDSANTSIIGQIEWPDLNAIHRIEGNLDGNRLSFEETEYIKKGKAYLNVKYTIMPEGNEIKGIWYDKKHNQQGSVSLATGTDSATNPEIKAAKVTDTPNGEFLKHEYGFSGNNEPLILYKISNNISQNETTKKILCVFAIHGFEDAFYKDGQVLTDIANDVTEYFSNNRTELNNYELLVIPCANPDGLKHGWTCNGPGRCQLSQGIDINMDFDYSFKIRTNARNKTGDKPFTSPEAQALKELVIEESPDIIIDFHGYINCASGDKEIADIFCKNLGLTYQPTESAIYKGFFSGWAANDAKSVLVEYPDPITGKGACSSKSDKKYNYTLERLDELQYSEKTINAIKEIVDCQL